MKIHVADKAIIDRVLKRKRIRDYKVSGVDLSEMFTTILMWANEFVPSEAGSILLDDPVLDVERNKPGHLYFVACFGKGSAPITGTSLPANVGIVGKTYKSGRPYISKIVSHDPAFCKTIDKQTHYSSKSIICVPIEIGGATIGVLELINKKGSIRYDSRDLTLLEVFAGYTSTLIQNSIDAKRFSEMSIRDNLTGLYNDRYFFEILPREIKAARKTGKDLSLVFMDLDKFKSVNDTHGHLAGSQLLREVGGILLAYTEHSNLTAVRYGGDEFIVVLPGKDIKKAALMAEEIRKTVEKFVFLATKMIAGVPALYIKDLITGSIGVASLRANVKANTSVRLAREAIIRAADTSMYDAKLKGKNRVSVSGALLPERKKAL